MTKTAPKSRSKTSKKSSTKVASRSSASKKQLSSWEKYCQERDSFYQCHPNIQWLLAVFIVVFLIYLALLFAPTVGYGYSTLF